MQTRMQPISVVFSKFPRVIRDLAKKVGKDIGLTLIGQEVELDKSIIELLSDPLTHLIRNCADHGIESPEARRRAGKSPKGEVVMRAHQESGKVIIEVHDDGAGIDPKMIRDKAIEKGVVSKEKASAMTDAELQLLIFAPGFSTAKQVSDVSGRGVGMDVVKTNIERLGGTVEVESEPGKGTTVVMKMPLTLAIIPSLIVETGDRRFAIPQMGLEEVVRIRGQDISKKVERVQNSEVLRLRGKLLPLIRLADALGMTRTFIHPGTGERLPDKRGRWSDRRGLPPGAHEDEDEAIAQEALPKDERRKGEQDRRKAIANAVKVIVLRTEKNRYGLVVEDVLDSEEIVVKPLPDYLKTTQCYAGATIMGDGKVAMILDPNGIATIANLRFVELEKDIEAEQERQRRKDQATLHNMVLFTLGGAERFATELGSIARIEKRAIQDIEVIGDREFVKYEDSSLRLLRLEHHLPISAPAARQSHVFVIVPKGGAKQAGIVVHKVEDTMMTELKLDTSSMRGPGVSGTSIIGKKMTIVLDMKRFLEAVQVE